MRMFVRGEVSEDEARVLIPQRQFSDLQLAGLHVRCQRST